MVYRARGFAFYEGLLGKSCRSCSSMPTIFSRCTRRPMGNRLALMCYCSSSAELDALCMSLIVPRSFFLLQRGVFAHGGRDFLSVRRGRRRGCRRDLCTKEVVQSVKRSQKEVVSVGRTNVASSVWCARRRGCGATSAQREESSSVKPATKGCSLWGDLNLSRTLPSRPTPTSYYIPSPRPLTISNTPTPSQFPFSPGMRK